MIMVTLAVEIVTSHNEDENEDKDKDKVEDDNNNIDDIDNDDIEDVIRECCRFYYIRSCYLYLPTIGFDKVRVLAIVW